MKGLFNAALNRSLNVAVDSATITLSGIGSNVPMSLIGGGTLYKNGVSVTNTTVSDGDTVRLRVQSSTIYATPTFGVAKIGNEEQVFTVATIPDPAFIFNQADDNLLPFDFTKNVDGSNYTPLNANELSVYTASTGALFRQVDLSSAALKQQKVTDTVMIADYHRDSVYAFNTSFGITATFSTGVGSKPYGFATTKTDASNDTGLMWVTLSGLNKVVVYDVTYTQVLSFDVGSRPFGIAATSDGSNVYVANYGSGTVSHFTYANSTWNQTVVNVGANPFEIAIDAAGNAWVSCVSDDRVYKISAGDAVTSYSTGQQGHRGLAFDKNGVLWIAAAESSCIVRMDANGTVLGTISTARYPFSIAANDDGSVMHVACFSDSKVSSYNFDGSLVRTFDVDKFPYGVSYYSGYVLVANMYPNTPSYFTQKDQTVTPFAIVDPQSVKRNALVTSNTITIAGLSTDTPVAIPANVWGAILIKNGVNVGTSSTVVNGDTLALQFTAPSTYATDVEIPFVVGNFYESFITRSEPEKTAPDTFVFKSIVNANLSTEYTSEAITITGLSDGTIVPFTVDIGTIILNGVEQAAKTVSVQNGDQVALKCVSATDAQTPVFASVTCGIATTLEDDGTPVAVGKASWSIITKNLDADILWIKPEYKGKGEFLPTPQTLVTDIATKVISRIHAKVREAFTVDEDSAIRDATKAVIPSVFDGALYQFNGTTFDTLAAPGTYTGRPVDIAGNRFVGFDTNYILDLQTQKIILTPGGVRRLLYVDVTETLYASLANGSVGVYKKGSNGVYSLNTTIKINTSTAPYGLAVDATGAVWVSDLVTGVVTRCVANYAMESVTAGVGIFDMAVSNGFLWTANSYDNTLTKIDVATKKVAATIKLNSCPQHIEVDSNDGSLWVSMYGTKSIQNFDATGTKIGEITLPTATTSMISFGGDIYVAELYPNLVEAENKISKLTPLVLDFGYTTDEAKNSHVLSPKVKVAGLIRPTQAFIEPNNNYSLYVNGALVPSGKATLWNGDVVYLDVLMPNQFYVQRIVTLNDWQSINEFGILTEGNAKPDFMAFLDIYNVRPRISVATEALTVSGLVNGQRSSLHVKDADWMLSINGGPLVSTAVVMNGDTVQMVGPPHQSYNAQRTYTLIAGKNGYICGSVTLHSFELSGGIYYDLNPPRLSDQASYDKKEYRNWSAFSKSEESAWTSRARRSLHTIAQGGMYESRRSRSFSKHTIERPLFESRVIRERHTVEVEPIYEMRAARAVNKVEAEPIYEMRVARAVNKVEVEPIYEARVSNRSHLIPAPIPSYVKKETVARCSNSPNFVILEYGKPRPVDTATQFTRNEVQAHASIEPQYVVLTRHSLAQSLIEPMTVKNTVHAQRTIDSPPIFMVTRQLKTFTIPQCVKAEKNDPIVINPVSYVRAPRMNAILLDPPYAKASNFNKVFLSMPTAIKSERRKQVVDVLFQKEPYIVNRYTLAETQAIRGGWATAEEAIAAGVAAGYPKSYAVQIQSDCYMWATPVEEGDYGGIPTEGGSSGGGAGHGQFAVPFAWHMQGG